MMKMSLHSTKKWERLVLYIHIFMAYFIDLYFFTLTFIFIFYVFHVCAVRKLWICATVCLNFRNWSNFLFLYWFFISYSLSISAYSSQFSGNKLLFMDIIMKISYLFTHVHWLPPLWTTTECNRSNCYLSRSKINIYNGSNCLRQEYSQCTLFKYTHPNSTREKVCRPHIDECETLPTTFFRVHSHFSSFVATLLI